MKYVVIALIVSITSFLGNMAYADESISACTMQYAPVCGSIQVQCFAAPCYPVRQTFGNQCMANVANATNITIGECGTLPPVVGGDRDIHGCIASAGYRWESRAQQCLRPWESRVRILYVAPTKQICPNMTLTQCLQIRLSFEKFWKHLIGDITGFEYVPGYMYRLLVLEIYPNILSNNGQSTSYSLIRTLNKRLTHVTTLSPIIGNWKLTHFNNSDVSTGNFSAIFSTNTFSVKLCNGISGRYLLSGSTFTTSNTMSTRMYCDGLPMTLENAWQLDGASYTIQTLPQTFGWVWTNHQMSITMKNGDTFLFSR